MTWVCSLGVWLCEAPCFCYLLGLWWLQVLGAFNWTLACPCSRPTMQPETLSLWLLTALLSLVLSLCPRGFSPDEDWVQGGLTDRVPSLLGLVHRDLCLGNLPPESVHSFPFSKSGPFVNGRFRYSEVCLLCSLGRVVILCVSQNFFLQKHLKSQLWRLFFRCLKCTWNFCDPGKFVCRRT